MKPSFMPYFSAVAGWLCLVTTVAAQEPSPSVHSLADDIWALQFGVGENLTLRDFQGPVISAKHHSSGARAIRYGLSVLAEHVNGDAAAALADQTRVSVGLVAHFLNYPTLARDPRGRVQMFWGLGPRLGLDVRRFGQPEDETVTARTVSVGAGGTVGVEWFIRPRISLSAEYETTLMAGFSSDPEPTDWVVRLGPRGVLFGVSAYF